MTDSDFYPMTYKVQQTAYYLLSDAFCGGVIPGINQRVA